MKASHKVPQQITALLASLTFSLQAGAQNIYLYDASLGTLPEAQGFVYYQTDGGAMAAVNGGVLHQYGNAALGGYQFWYATNAPFDFATNTYTMEITLRVLSATDLPPSVDPNNDNRGFQFSAIDSAGYVLNVHIGTNSFTMVGNCEVTKTNFNAADGFHTYRVVLSNKTALLFIDGVLFASKPIIGAPLHPDHYARTVYFGDGSGWATSQVLVRHFRFALESAPTLSIYPAIELVIPTETNKTYQLQHVAEAGMTTWMNLGAPIVGTGTNVSTFDSTRSSARRFYRVQLVD